MNRKLILIGGGIVVVVGIALVLTTSKVPEAASEQRGAPTITYEIPKTNTGAKIR